MLLDRLRGDHHGQVAASAQRARWCSRSRRQGHARIFYPRLDESRLELCVRPTDLHATADTGGAGLTRAGCCGMCATDKLLDLPFGLAPLLDNYFQGRGTIASVGISAHAVAVQFYASAYARLLLKHGREVHVDASTRFAFYNNVVAGPLTTEASVRAEILDRSAYFYVSGRVEVESPALTVEDVRGLELLHGRAGKWRSGKGPADANIQVVVSVGTPDWLVHRVTRVEDPQRWRYDYHEYLWSQILQPAVIMTTGLVDKIDLKQLAAIEGSLRCPGAPLAPVDVLVAARETKDGGPGFVVELRKNPTATTDGSIFDALENAVCFDDLANEGALRVQTALSAADSTSSELMRSFANKVLNEIQRELVKLRPKLSLAAGPNLSRDVRFHLDMPLLGEYVQYKNFFRLIATVTKADITNAIRNVPVALINGHDVSLTASIGGHDIQLVKFEGMGKLSGESKWYPGPDGQNNGQAHAKSDVCVVMGAVQLLRACLTHLLTLNHVLVVCRRNPQFGEVTLLGDPMPRNIMHEIFSPPSAPGEPWSLRLGNVGRVEFQPATPSNTGERA